jgi:hypothetical protein
MEGTPYDDRVGVHEGRYPETALAKAAVWYDGYEQEQVTKLARAIENVAVPKGAEECRPWSTRAWSRSKDGRPSSRMWRGCWTRSSPRVGCSRWP